MVCAIGGLPKCAKFTCSGDTFQGCWLLLILMIVTKVLSVQHINIVMFINGVWYRGSSVMWQINTHWWHFSKLLVIVNFDHSFNTKFGSVDHIIIVIYINGVCYRGSSEMCQIHTHWWHFSRLLVTVDLDDSFNTAEWAVDHIIIVIYINGVCWLLFC